jgi:hypothetical protein
MAAPTFLDILRSEVARMQALHPEREGELARAHALIMHGMVLPSDDDPTTGQVLSSDGEKRYTGNGTCDCQAGQHGRACKHLQSWRLYQYVARKVEAASTAEVVHVDTKNLPLPEAPASVNLKVLIGGHETQITLRDSSEARLLDRLHTLLKRQDLRPLPKPAPRTGNWKPRGR